MAHTYGTPVDQPAGPPVTGPPALGHATPRTPPSPQLPPRRLLPRFLRQEHVVGQILRFGVVGGLNTLVDYGTFNLLVVVFGLNPVAANPISVTAGIINSFIWNKHWTFASGGWHRWYRQALLFVIISVIGLLINTGGLSLLLHLTGAESVLAVNLQKLAASVVSLTWNFIGYRFLVFRGTRSRA